MNKKPIGLVLRDTEESLGKTNLHTRNTLIIEPSNSGILHNASNSKRPRGEGKRKRQRQRTKTEIKNKKGRRGNKRETVTI